LKKYIYLTVLIAVFLNLSCFDLFYSKLTITNDSTSQVNFYYWYYDDDDVYESGSLTIYPGETRKVTIYSSYTYVSVDAYNSSGFASYNYYGGDNEIIMYDSDF